MWGGCSLKRGWETGCGEASRDTQTTSVFPPALLPTGVSSPDSDAPLMDDLDPVLSGFLILSVNV